MHAAAYDSMYRIQSREVDELTVEIECKHIRVVMLYLLAHALRFAPEYVDAYRHYKKGMPQL